ncbi:MAG: galactose oxidase [Verrucomicrobiales bacterium]|nr:galactose oxidase [Verrucomicrobiales bacterium]
MDTAIDDLPSGGNTPDSHPAEQGALLDFDPARNVLSNDTSGLTSVILAGEAAHGSVVLKNDGTFSYQPHPNFTGTDHFAYTAGGGAGFILPGTAMWKWLRPLRGVDPEVDTPGFQANWMKPGFDDSAWKTGAGQMGYGVLGSGNGVTLDTNIGTPGGVRYTAYFRTAFDVPGPQAPGVTVEFSCDDAAILYLNGDEIGRYVQAPAGGFATAPDIYSLRIHQITAGAVSNPTYVSISVRDAGHLRYPGRRS